MAAPETTPPPTDDQPPAADTAPVEYKPGILPTQSTVTQKRSQRPGRTARRSARSTTTMAGLGQSMWVNAPRPAVEDLLGSIPYVSADPFVRDLSRRVLLTPSDAPAGSAKRALVTIRIEKLLQGGSIDEAGTIAATLHLDNDPDFARVQADALLYAGRDKDVCGDLTATRATSPDPFLAGAAHLLLRGRRRQGLRRPGACGAGRRRRQGSGVRYPGGDATSGAKKPSPTSIIRPRCTSICCARRDCR